MAKQRTYTEFMDVLDDIASGNTPSNLEKKCEKAGMLFSSPLNIPEIHSKNTWTNKTANNFREYFELKGARKLVDINGAKRQIATESEILIELKRGNEIFSDIVAPYFHNDEQFIAGLVKENYNLGLAYLSSIIQGCASDFVPFEQRVEEKNRAVNIAKCATSIKNEYKNNRRLTSRLVDEFSKMRGALNLANPDMLRPYEAVIITPKSIYKKEQMESNIIDMINQDHFFPDAILPVAHGGVGLGLELNYHFENNGHFPSVFPIFYSAKTRRHVSPKLEGDELYLKNLKNKNLLITEDWITTGKTLIGITPSLKKHNPQDIRIATLKQDPRSSNLSEICDTKIYAGSISRYMGSK